MNLRSNEPFWLIKNGLPASYPSLNEDKTCDVLIVGGGITGSLIAHQCMEEGLRTILVDKREIGNGSSSATTSMLQYEIDVPLYKLMATIGEEGALASYEACSKAIDTLGVLCHSIKSKSGFTKKDSLYYAAYKKDVKWLKTEYKERKRAGYPVKWLETDELKERYGIHTGYGAILSRQGGSVDAFCLLHELLQLNIGRGLEVFDKTELVRVQFENGLNKCTLATGGTITAKRVVYCTGYETAAMIPEKFVNLISSWAIVSEVDEELFRDYRDVLIWNTANPYLYMRTSDDHRFLIGGADEGFRDSVKRDRLIGRKADVLVNAFKKIFADLAPIRADFAWAGTFGETKDGLPYIGEHSGFPNSYFVCGFGGNGITFSVAGMEMVAAWIRGDVHPLTEWFRFGR